MLEMIVAECSLCGATCYSFDEEDAIEKYEKHKCMATLTDRQIHNILTKVLNGIERD